MAGNYVHRWSGEEIDNGIERALETPRPNLLDNWDFTGAEIMAKAGAPLEVKLIDYMTEAITTLPTDTKCEGYEDAKGKFVVLLSNGQYYVAPEYCYQKPGSGPINQRGKAKYPGNGATIDRWSNVSSTGSLVTDESIVVYGNWGLYQRIEPNRTPKGIYTFSCLARNSTGALSFSAEGSSTSRSIYVYNLGKLVGTNWSMISITREFDGHTWFGISFGGAAGSRVEIAAAKLEKGPTQTLARKDANGNWVLIERPDYWAELAKCQRYYYNSMTDGGERGMFKVTTLPTGRTTGSSIHYALGVRFPIRMRTIPAITFYSTVNKTKGKASYGTSGADTTATPTAVCIGSEGFSQINLNGVDDKLNSAEMSIQFFIEANAEL